MTFQPTIPIEELNQIVTLLYYAALLMLGDLVLGALSAWLVGKNFKWDKITGFLVSDGGPILAWFVSASLMAFIPGEYVPDLLEIGVPGVIYTAVMARMSASVLASVASFGLLKQPLARVGITKEQTEPTAAVLAMNADASMGAWQESEDLPRG